MLEFSLYPPPTAATTSIRSSGGQWRHCVTAFRDDFAVALDSDALALESKLANEVGHRRGWIATNMDQAIDQEREHAGGSIGIERGAVVILARAGGRKVARVSAQAKRGG